MHQTKKNGVCEGSDLQPMSTSVCAAEMKNLVMHVCISLLVVVRSVDEAHVPNNVRVAQPVIVDIYLVAQDQQAGERNPNAEEEDTEKAYSQCEGEMPAMEAAGAHVQHPVPMIANCLQSIDSGLYSVCSECL